MSEFADILRAIQNELGSDFVAAYIISPGGEILAKISEILSRVNKLSKANLAGVIKLVSGLRTSLCAGPIEELLVTFTRGYILIISIRENAGYLGLVVRRKEALDLARLLAKEFASELAGLTNSE